MTETCILLVEDDPDILDILVLALSSEGYLVDTAATVADAMSRLAQIRYALVATDWQLPDGRGTLIADHAADLGSKTIIFSGYLLTLPPDPLKRHAVLMKPIRPSEFIEAVKQQTGRSLDL